MKRILKRIFDEDISKYDYLVIDKKKYRNQKIMCLVFGLIAIVPIVIITLGINYLTFVIMIFGLYGCIKIPYTLLKFMHNAKTNEMVSAIPLWINSLYSLIGENNISNTIKLSYVNAPECMKSDLKKFIEDIERDNNDKETYINFLSEYEIDGLNEIMLKLFEFRNLSKDNLRYEILNLSKSLGKIEKKRMDNRCKNELFFVDILGNVMIMIPSLYVFYLSTMLSSLILR
ncbi:MAG: hypothetical protein RSC93_07260 [Erysipelotrichaceae bacterium]